MPVHSKKQAQVGALLFDKVFFKVPVEYSDYSNVFSAENTVELPKNTRINEHIIELEKSKQPFFGSIHNLGPIELETLKTYIKTNLANGFIQSFMSPIGAFILFDRKPNRSFCFGVDYWDLNNITIKNQYPLFLINKLLDWLRQIKRFT